MGFKCLVGQIKHQRGDLSFDQVVKIWRTVDEPDFFTRTAPIGLRSLGAVKVSVRETVLLHVAGKVQVGDRERLHGTSLT